MSVINQTLIKLLNKRDVDRIGSYFSLLSFVLLFTLRYCVACVNIFSSEEPLEDDWHTLTTPELLIGWNLFVFEGYNSSEMRCHILSVTIEGDLIKTESFHRSIDILFRWLTSTYQVSRSGSTNTTRRSR